MNKADARAIRNAAVRETLAYPPERVKQTRRTRGEVAAKKQAVAIALDRARAQVAKVPRR